MSSCRTLYEHIVMKLFTFQLGATYFGRLVLTALKAQNMLYYVFSGFLPALMPRSGIRVCELKDCHKLFNLIILTFLCNLIGMFYKEALLLMARKSLVPISSQMDRQCRLAAVLTQVQLRDLQHGWCQNLQF